MLLTPYAAGICGCSPRALHRRPGRTVFPAMLAATLCAAMLAGPAHAQEISAAEKILFQDDHFKKVAKPQSLRYRYLRQDQGKTGFSDQVVVNVGARANDGSAPVSVQFLTGERQLALPEISGAHGNPAVLGFLERDIGEMKRLTGGSTNYFRKRIRLALAEAASVEPVSVSYGGRRLQGSRIAIQPYLDDPMQEKMRKYVGKRYVFIVSDDIPGAVYQLASVVPGEQKSGAALIEETMTLEASPP
jgi:hypothetical protein